MKLKYQIKSGGKVIPVGDYKSGTLKKEVEEKFKAKGYFEFSEKSNEPPNYFEVPASELVKLKQKELIDAISSLGGEQINEALELEKEKSKPREKVLSALEAALG